MEFGQKLLSSIETVNAIDLVIDSSVLIYWRKFKGFFVCLFVFLVLVIHLCVYVYLLLWRYVAQGKGILQPHHLIDEFDNAVCDDTACVKLKEGPFYEVLKSAQVYSPIRTLNITNLIMNRHSCLSVALTRVIFFFVLTWNALKKSFVHW